MVGTLTGPAFEYAHGHINQMEFTRKSPCVDPECSLAFPGGCLSSGSTGLSGTPVKVVQMHSTHGASS